MGVLEVPELSRKAQRRGRLGSAAVPASHSGANLNKLLRARSSFG